MNIRIEVSSHKEFMATSEQLVEYLESNEEIDFEILEDNVGFGNEEILLIGITFFMQSVAEGFSYDAVRYFFQSSIQHIRSIYDRIPKDAKDNTYIYIESQDGSERHEIRINTDKDDIEVSWQDLKIVLRSNKDK